MTDIKRIGVTPRISTAVVHNGLAWLAGKCAERGGDATEQTKAVLAEIDAALTAAGTDKSRLLKADIWLSSMEHYDAMNKVWDAWLPEGCAPARVCGQIPMAREDFIVEITVVAAMP